ncbi:MAG TPA: glycosyltransferase family 1 protein [Pyrinomonadaceae bacterium]|nr:glycosyltransferase family 1 protein [Pyrinomonadaceae bacterium]
MRVGIDGYPLAEPRTGVGHYTLELARALALISPSDHFELVSPAPFDSAALDEIERAQMPNLHTTNPRASSIRGHWWSIGLPLYARRARFDLFHGTNFDVPLWKKRRSVVTIHDLSALLHPEKHRSRLVRRARLRLPLVVRVADMIITPTESVKREVCHHLSVKADKITAIPSAARRSFQPLPFAQTAETRKRLGVEDNFLLFVGTLEPRKNLLTLLKAFAQILSQSSLNPQLVIAGGEGWLMDDSFAFIKRAALSERLRFTGYLSDDDLRALYSSCRVFIYPSVYEGFGLPPLEAMACGAPVIAGRISSLQETLGSVARLVEPLDVDALAKSITEVLEDDNQREMMVAAGPTQAGKFSWEQTARLTLDVYRQLA